jgi:hypothetical protein
MTVPEAVDMTSATHSDAMTSSLPQHDPMYITQPGSTVATSLSKEEAGQKMVAMLEVSEHDCHQ